jgi:hypothetical protein
MALDRQEVAHEVEKVLGANGQRSVLWELREEIETSDVVVHRQNVQLAANQLRVDDDAEVAELGDTDPRSAAKPCSAIGQPGDVELPLALEPGREVEIFGRW